MMLNKSGEKLFCRPCEVGLTWGTMLSFSQKSRITEAEETMV